MCIIYFILLYFLFWLPVIILVCFTFFNLVFYMAVENLRINCKYSHYIHRYCLFKIPLLFFSQETQSSVNFASLSRKKNPSMDQWTMCNLLMWNCVPFAKLLCHFFVLRDHNDRGSLHKMNCSMAWDANKLCQCKQVSVYFPDSQLCMYKCCNYISVSWG